jgi:hypothetical protein
VAGPAPSTMRGTILAPSSKFHCQLGASTSGTPGSISSTWEASSDLQALEQVFDNFTIGYHSLQLFGVLIQRAVCAEDLMASLRQ